jgi:hypothetical protein
MKTIRAKTVLILLVAASVAAPLYGQSGADYPHLGIAPTSPISGDSVVLSLVLGQSPNSCTPSFSNESLWVEVSPLAIYPPLISVYLTYTTTPPPEDMMCLMVPTEYGPGFSLPDANVGNYTVIDATTDSVVGEFTVSAGRRVSGTVTDDPGLARRLPRPLDSVRVSLANGSPVVVGDETYDDTLFTNADGEFSFAGVPDDSYIISFSRRGYASQLHRLEVTADTSLSVRMIPEGQNGIVQGTVRFVVWTSTPRPPIETQPLAQCTLYMSPDWYVASDIPIFSTVTDSTGAFTFDNIPMSYSGQRMTVTAHKSGFESQTIDTSMTYMVITELAFILSPETHTLRPDASRRIEIADMRVAYRASTGVLEIVLPQTQKLRITTLDMSGRRIDALSRTMRLTAGIHSLPVADIAGPGVYLVRIDGNQSSLTNYVRICR